MPLSPLKTGLSGLCPRCGKGHLFQGFLSLRPSCEACELDYSFADSADGPAVFIMFIVGFLVVGLALWTEFTFEPPLWVHMMLWLPLTIIASLALLRPLKGILVAVQYAHKAEQGRFL
jgi:uncharacterized protein (DUF983 family)